MAILVGSVIALLAFVIGLISGGGGGSDPVEETASAEVQLPELPRGGRELLPAYRLVAYYGAPGSEELGALGIGTPAEATAELLRQAKPYETEERPVMPVLELLAVVAASDPGEDGLYRNRASTRVIDRYLRAARERDALLLLDIQPGRSSFAAEVARLDRYLREPDVGLALDPEWHVGPDEVPGQVIGSVSAATVNRISAGLAAITERENLPQKLFVIHQFTGGMIANRAQLVARPNLATVINVDGFGSSADKIAKYEDLHPNAGSPLHSGFKLFYSEDFDLMSPDQVLELRPEPDLIVYE